MLINNHKPINLSQALIKHNSLDRNIITTRLHWPIPNLCKFNKHYRRPRITTTTTTSLISSRRRIVPRDLSQSPPINRHSIRAGCLYPVSLANLSTNMTLTNMASCTFLVLRATPSLGRIQTLASKRSDLLQVLWDRVVQAISSVELQLTLEP